MPGCLILPASGQDDENSGGPPSGTTSLVPPVSGLSEPRPYTNLAPIIQTSAGALTGAPTQSKQDLPPVIPPPPAVTLPEVGQAAVNKTPLAWRAKALAMSAEYPFNEKNSMLWLLPVAYDKGQTILKRAIKQAGFELSAQYPDAGQYLIDNGIIIVSQPAGDAKTLFKLRIYSNSKIPPSNKAYSIPTVMKNMLDNHELWQ